jgi:diacylglycerol O-acyltransferase / wax synthase
VALPAAGSLDGRITAIAAITQQRKTAAKGTSVALLGPLFRLLARAGLLRRFVNRQRLVHIFTTNLRGPAQPLTFAGAPLRAVIPIATTVGNVPITFAALSYAGTVWLTVLSDPDQASDVETPTAALRQELPPTPG